VVEGQRQDVEGNVPEQKKVENERWNAMRSRVISEWREWFGKMIKESNVAFWHGRKFDYPKL
jgi:hypothetical protein